MTELLTLLKTLLSSTFSRKTIMPIFLTTLTMIAGTFIVFVYGNIATKINIIPAWVYGICIFCGYWLLFDKIDSKKIIAKKEKDLKNKKDILIELEKLRNIDHLKTEGVTQQDYRDWANKVAPLLKQVSMQNYVNFAPYSQQLNNDDLPSNLAMSYFNTMVSNLDQAINELKEIT